MEFRVYFTLEKIFFLTTYVHKHFELNSRYFNSFISSKRKLKKNKINLEKVFAFAQLFIRLPHGFNQLPSPLMINFLRKPILTA